MSEQTYTPDLAIDDCCEQCGCDLDDDRHGALCASCWIYEGAYEAADADYDMSVEG